MAVEYCHCDKKIVYGDRVEEKEKVLYLLLTKCDEDFQANALLRSRLRDLIVAAKKRYEIIFIFGDQINGIFLELEFNPEFKDPQISYEPLNCTYDTDFEAFYDEYSRFCLLEVYTVVPYVLVSESLFLSQSEWNLFEKSLTVDDLRESCNQYHFKLQDMFGDKDLFAPYRITDVCKITKKKKPRVINTYDCTVPPATDYNNFFFEHLNNVFEKYKATFVCDSRTNDIKSFKLLNTIRR